MSQSETRCNHEIKNIICVPALFHFVALGSRIMAADIDLAAAFPSQQSGPPYWDSKR
jgi:hypothetical protein